MLVPSVMMITLVGLRLNESYNGQAVFLRSESGQIHSELVNVTVGKLFVCSKYNNYDCLMILIVTEKSNESDGLCSPCDIVEMNIAEPCSSWREVGIAVGVVVCLAVGAVIIVIVVLCWWR